MKIFGKKLCVSIIAASLLLASTSCGANPGGNQSKYSDRANTLNVTIFNAGYGMEWFEQVANYYMDNVDEDTYVKIVTTVMNDSELAKIQAGITSSDIYLLDGPLDFSYGTVADLSDVYDSYPLGETEYTIAEKASGLVNTYRNFDGKYYSLPWGSRLGFSFMYNKTSIDEALGKGTWNLPRTTVEFFELGDRLLQNNMYLYTASYSDQMDYLHWGQQVWLAQAMGMEAYDNFFNGYYWDETEWKFASDYPYMITQNEENIKSFYKVLYDLALPGNNYIHANSNILKFTDIETVFAGYGYGRNPAKTAFIFEGPWGENEVRLVCDVIGDEFTDEIGAMKMPMNSQILARTPSIQDEAMLRLVIDYVDGNSDTLPQGVTEEDVAKVDEARHMVGTLMTAKIMLAETCQNKDLAKNFLRFLATDVAQGLSKDYLNGLNVLPFDYKTTPKGKNQDSNYVKTLEEVCKDSINIQTLETKYTFSRITGFEPYTNTYLLANGIFSMSSASQVQTPQQYYNQLLSIYETKWAGMVRDYNAYMEF